MRLGCLDQDDICERLAEDIKARLRGILRDIDLAKTMGMDQNVLISLVSGCKESEEVFERMYHIPLKASDNDNDQYLIIDEPRAPSQNKTISNDIIAVKDGQCLTLEQTKKLHEEDFHMILHIPLHRILIRKDGNIKSKLISFDIKEFYPRRITILRVLTEHPKNSYTLQSLRDNYPWGRELADTTFHKYIYLFRHKIGQKGTDGYIRGWFELINGVNEYLYAMDSQKHYLVIRKRFENPSDFLSCIH